MGHPTGGGRRGDDDRDDQRRRQERTHRYADEENEENPDEEAAARDRDAARRGRRAPRSGYADQLAGQLRSRREVVTALPGPSTPINRDRVRERRGAQRARVSTEPLVNAEDAAAMRRRAARFATSEVPASTPQVGQRPAQRSQEDRFREFDDVRGSIRFAGSTGEENCRKHLRDDEGSGVLCRRFGAAAEDFAAYFISRARLADMELDNKTDWDGQPSSQSVDTGRPQFRLYLDRISREPNLHGWKIVGYVNRNHLALTHLGPGL